MLALTWLVAPSAVAQMAPTGNHYAGRPSDTGYGGSVAASGGAYVVSVPLDFPAARDGLPIPVSIVHGRQGLGAAGLNWDIPISFVRRDRTLAHRRPAFAVDAFPVTREQVSLSLFGRTIDLVRRGSEWVARDGAPGLIAREITGGDWIVEDGSGRTSRFSQPTELRNAGLWLLKSVKSADGAEIVLNYVLNTWPIAGSTAIELNLTHISYNRHPIAPCFKNVITLAYSSPAVDPLSISMFGEVALIRKRTVNRIDVSGRAGCTESPQRLRRYILHYSADTDTKLPRLLSVKMFGRQGTAEENAALPVASYEYGSATSAGVPNFIRVLRYARTQTVALPSQADASKLSGTTIEPVSGDPGPRYTMWQTLLDVTGDGRPELVFKKDNKLWMAYNRPATGGTTTLGILQGSVGVRELADATFGNRALSMHIATSPRYSTTGQNTVEFWRQAIDVNADGRIDVVDAKELSNAWVVYLNTPGGPTGVIWQRRLLSTANLAQGLRGAGHALEDNQVPLSRRSSGRNGKAAVCWKWNEVPRTWTVAALNSCANGDPFLRDRLVSDDQLAERTYVEWELSDLNGDGYPDFVFNTTPVTSRLGSASVTPPSGATDEQTRRDLRSDPFVKREELIPFGPAMTNAVRAFFNMAGVRFAADFVPPFGRSVDLRVASDVMGVGAWDTMKLSPTSTAQHMVAGFVDANGDGVSDRVANNRAYLGVFHGTARFFSNISIALPGPASVQRNEHPERCPLLDSTKFASELVAGLRDFTGDGIPDYFNRNSVHIGTGVSFAPAVAIEGAPQSFSLQQETCDGDVSNTTRGLFDIDGDGKPEMLVLEGQSIVVYQLAAGAQPRSPEAGRLTAIDNGYGAKTNISYVSAKEDDSSAHQIPSPEIVVTAVRTTRPADILAESRFAYGGAEMFFDSLRDRFVFPGYLKRVWLRLYGPRNRPQGMATVADSWPLLPFNTAMTKPERWARLRRVGLPRDTYTLRGSGQTNPWELLGVDVQDPGVIGATHQVWDAKAFEAPAPAVANFRDCIEMSAPYDFEQSALASLPTGLDVCRVHGFAFQKQGDAWRGSQPPPSTSNVQTRWRAVDVDDFGRTTFAQLDNDIRLSDDDICVERAYAAHVGNSARTLTAVSSRRVTDCGRRITYASESWAYDGLPTGRVSKGHVTAHIVDRRATDNGAFLGSIKTFDAEYDAMGGLVALRSQRGAHTSVMRISYDPFGLVTTGTRIEATGIPAMSTVIAYDPVSLQPVRTTDVNGTERGVAYDGLGRPVRATLRPFGGQTGIVSTAAYEGFEGGSQGRQIAVKEFADPVASAQLSSAAGNKAVAFLDELGRPLRTEIVLGADYQNATLVAGARSYDLLGRVSFVADTHPKGANPATAYGTSYHFQNTGDIDCIIRGPGPQPLNRSTNLAAERFPTCLEQRTLDGVNVVEIRDAASLTAGSPQAGTVRRSISSAIGRELERSTIKQGVRLEHATFAYDRLGQLRRMTRYLDPVSPASPVELLQRMDSMGQVLRITEPDSAPRAFAYSDWGEPTETAWQDGAIARKIVSDYDALGRLATMREFAGGVEDSETRKSFQFDQGLTLSPLVSPAFTLGRLTGAQSASGQIAFSYDALGNVEAQIHTDRDGTAFVRRSSFSANGQLNALHFNLPDQGYASEVAKYDYDSARRLRAVTYSDALGTRELYRAETIDPLGRIRVARYGQHATFHADYAIGGRSLMSGAEVVSPAGSRWFGRFVYDALGRRVVHTELKDGAQSGRTTEIQYDALNQLSGTVQLEGNTLTSQIRFRYDALGNLLEQNDVLGNEDVVATYGPIDRDRLCFLTYGTGPTLTSSVCNVRYDAAGNTVQQPTRTGSRQFAYFNSGAVRSISQQTALSAAPPVTASFAYDAFGNVQELDVQGVDAAGGARADRRFGALIEKRSAGSGNGIILRNVPGPQGLMASRRGPAGDWIFAFRELRGARFFVDQEGRFVQDIDYRPFGAAISSGAPVSAVTHSARQWNGSDTLSAFGLSHLGARLYDPVIGRFLSRDPIVTPRGGASTNPYAFALNDPFNLSDPSGLDPADEKDEESWWFWRTMNVALGNAEHAEAALLLRHTWNMPWTTRAWGFSKGADFPGGKWLGRAAVTDDVKDLASTIWTYNKVASGENKGRLILSGAKLLSNVAGFYGWAASAGIDIGLWHWERKERAFRNVEMNGENPEEPGSEAQEIWVQMQVNRYRREHWAPVWAKFWTRFRNDLDARTREAQERNLANATTCVEDTVCRLEEPDRGPASEVPFGPVWIPHLPPPPSSPVQPLVPSPQSPGSFYNPFSDTDWGTIGITETNDVEGGPPR